MSAFAYKPPGFRPGLQPVKQRVASKIAGSTFHPPPPGYRPGFPSLGGATAPVTPPAAGGTPPIAGAAAPAADPQMPDPKDATYEGSIADIISKRKILTSNLASQFTNDEATATTGANKSGLLHSSSLANRLAQLQTNFQNQSDYQTSQYGNPNTPGDYGTLGTQALGEAQQRHLGDPAPTVVDNSTLQSLNAGRFAPGHTVQLASGWRILYDASNKPVRFLKPGETYNGQ